MLRIGTVVLLSVLLAVLGSAGAWANETNQPTQGAGDGRPEPNNQQTSEAPNGGQATPPDKDDLDIDEWDTDIISLTTKLLTYLASRVPPVSVLPN